MRSSFRYAWNGFVRTVREERNMRFHLCAAFYVIALGYAAQIEPWAWVAVFLCIGAVLAAECLNTALEAACNEITRNRSENIRTAKDAAAAMVLMFAAASVAVGAMIFLRAQRLAALAAYAGEHPFHVALVVLTIPLSLLFVFRR